jgi:hypothetical protein
MPHDPSGAFDDTGLLYQTAHGCMVRCGCCGRLELRFGPIALAEERSFFRRFRRAVCALALDAPEACPARMARAYVVSLGSDKLAFRFTRDEALELRDLLDGAAVMLDLDDLLHDTLYRDADRNDAPDASEAAPDA